MKKLGILVIVILLAAGAAYWYRGKRHRAPTAPAFTPPKVTGDPHLNYASMECDGGGCTLRIEVKAKSDCSMGDFNLMQLDLQSASDKPNYLLSVEPLLIGEANLDPMSQEMTLEETEAGAVKTFRLPRFQRPTQLGVFLCKDSKNERRCSTKEFTDFNSFMSLLFAGMRQGGKFRSSDHVYFFQYLFWEEEGKLAAMNDEDILVMSDETYRHRLDYVLSKSPQYPKERGETMDRVKALSLAVHSLPFEIDGSKLTVVLPKSDPNCKKK